MSENEEKKEIKKLFEILCRILSLVEDHLNEDLYEGHKRDGFDYVKENEINQLRIDLEILERKLMESDFIKALEAL